MELFGCGFNGFGQLLPRRTERCLLSPVKVFPKSVLATGKTVRDEFRKFGSSWSAIYVLIGTQIWMQGFCTGEKKAKIQTLQTSEGDLLGSVADLDMSGERLFCIKTDGKCFAMDTRACRVLPVRGHGSAMPNLTKIAVGDLKTVAITGDSTAGLATCKEGTYIFRPFDCVVRFAQVSCGKEHVVLLTHSGQVYSFGLGSRGQLGHGTTDEAGQPRLLEALGCIAVTTISAGGWHSAVVSAIGDLYIWGWNESGQLGFPMQITSHTKLNSTMQDIVLETCDHPSRERMPVEPKRTHQGDEDTGQDETKKRKFSTELDVFSFTLSAYAREDLLDSEHEIPGVSNLGSGKRGHRHDSANKEPGELKGDAVPFQALPSILDLPGSSEVSKVSCGSRHTAAISGDGLLYTWGWGEYGQLGHGDRQTRDTPTMVICLNDGQQSQVEDVSCGAWNTLFTIIS